MPQDIFDKRATKTTAPTTNTSAKKTEKPAEKSHVRDKQVEKPVDLQAQLHDLMVKHSAAQTELETALAEVRIQTDRIRELEEGLAASKAEAEQFKANLEAVVNMDVARHTAELEERLTDANLQIQKLANADERVKEMAVDLQYAREAQETLRAELDRVQGEFKTATEQLVQAQAAQPQADDDTVKQLREKLATAYGKAAEAQSQITDIEMTADERVAKAQEELTAANDKLAKLEAVATEAISQNTEAYNAGCAQANVRVQELEAKLANPEQELAVAQQRAADALAVRDRVLAEAVTTEDGYKKAVEEHKQSLSKERKITNRLAFIALSALFLLLVTYGFLFYEAHFGNPDVVNGPAQTFIGRKAQPAPDKTPSLAAGGSFQVTPDNLKALTGQSDPTCYVSNKLSMWGKDKKQTHFECSGQYIKDKVRDCWNVSACTIEVPKDLKK